MWQCLEIEGAEIMPNILLNANFTLRNLLRVESPMHQSIIHRQLFTSHHRFGLSRVNYPCEDYLWLSKSVKFEIFNFGAVPFLWVSTVNPWHSVTRGWLNTPPHLPCLMYLISNWWPGCYIFSQGYSLQFFLIFAHLWWFGVLGLGSYIGFLGFSVDGVWGLWCGAFWVFGFGLSI